MTTIVEVSTVTGTRSVAELLEAGVQPGCMVFGAASAYGNGSVPGWLVVEDNVSPGADRQCAIVSETFGMVLCGAISEVQVSGEPSPADREMPVWAEALAGAFWRAQRARVERDAALAMAGEQERRLERIVDAAHEYAEEQSLCSVFDEFMLSQGLRAREHDYISEVDVTVRIRIPATSHSAEAAANAIDDDIVRAALGRLDRLELVDAIQEHDVVDTEEA